MCLIEIDLFHIVSAHECIGHVTRYGQTDFKPLIFSM